jgi:hypothetical protein
MYVYIYKYNVIIINMFIYVHICMYTHVYICIYILKFYNFGALYSYRSELLFGVIFFSWLSNLSFYTSLVKF